MKAIFMSTFFFFLSKNLLAHDLKVTILDDFSNDLSTVIVKNTYVPLKMGDKYFYIIWHEAYGENRFIIISQNDEILNSIQVEENTKDLVFSYYDGNFIPFLWKQKIPF